jgi:hypothetical protein
MRQSIRRTAQVLIIVLALGAVAVWMTKNLSESSRFGKRVIRLADGTQLYAIRESWGLHTDQISLRKTPNGCEPADPSQDYIDSDAESLIYSENHGHFVIFQNPKPFGISSPKHAWSGAPVELRSAASPSWRDLDSDPTKYGVTVLRVPLDEFCWSHLFSATSSLRPKS